MVLLQCPSPSGDHYDESTNSGKFVEAISRSRNHER